MKVKEIIKWFEDASEEDLYLLRYIIDLKLGNQDMEQGVLYKEVDLMKLWGLTRSKTRTRIKNGINQGIILKKGKEYYLDE